MSIDDKDCVLVRFEGHNTPYFAYNVARIRVADEDKVMSQQELTAYIMERQSNEGVWERKVSVCPTTAVDEKRSRNIFAVDRIPAESVLIIPTETLC